MIREAASNVVSSSRTIKCALRSIPYQIEQFWEIVKSISKDYKWSKLVLLRHHIPIEVFDIMKPFFFVKNKGNLFYVAQIEKPIYHIPILAKLYQMGYINDMTMNIVTGWFTQHRIPYIMEPYPSHYYYHPQFSITLFIQCLVFLKDHHIHNTIEHHNVLSYWL